MDKLKQILIEKALTTKTDPQHPDRLIAGAPHIGPDHPVETLGREVEFASRPLLDRERIFQAHQNAVGAGSHSPEVRELIRRIMSFGNPWEKIYPEDINLPKGK